jgi:hypothetical protein
VVRRHDCFSEITNSKETDFKKGVHMSRESMNDKNSVLPHLDVGAIETAEGGLTPAQREFAAVIGQALADLWLKEIASKSDHEASRRTGDSETAR